ncbi:alpha-L-iduronidase [Biomphalaria pfeifferi]|uniref:Alpha-L-iduronidase n=1 Tax=Biomphalaria pfeifferi TaxID=112525 RepID=A0AAD8B9E5_BIOPF|nr:alpha-L-iduronidase [Biomphalaria pfeifferi]
MAPTVFFLMLQLCLVMTQSELNIFINSSDVRGQLTQFWRNTGFCPPAPHSEAANYDLSFDMQQNLAYIGAVPFSGITHVRVHWLFELVHIESIAINGPVYNFTELDKFVSLIHENELYLIFELMGNPSGVYTDMENKTQVYWWRDLVAQTAQRYITQYGVEYVREWKFETWNEPDCHDFDQLTMTVQGFLNYYDACSEGLQLADSSLVFGGPGDGCGMLRDSRDAQYAEALFNHTVRGINYFTGETKVRIDFISLHEKGQGGTALSILTEEIVAVDAINLKYPELNGKPFYNDEADPLVGWNKSFTWRADVTYAALVVKIISQHQNMLKARDNPLIANYALLSNDNGFLSYFPNQFTQRTLLARFQMNLTQPHYVTFVRKPVYMVMGMLALLGEKQLHVDISMTPSTAVSNTSDYGCISTVHEPNITVNSSDSWQQTVLIYGAPDINATVTYSDLNLQWYLIPPPGVTSLKLKFYFLYNGGSNPYDAWVGLFNSTAYPTLKQFAYLRDLEDPNDSIMDVKVTAGYILLPPRFQVLEPHIILMHLCSKPLLPPEKVIKLKCMNITQGQVLIVWSDSNIHTKCLARYDVELSQNGPSGPFTKINPRHSVVTAFIYETDSESKVEGYYKVRAVDYWNRGGDYSDPVWYKVQKR